MAAMAVDPSSSVAAAKLPTPPYHHSRGGGCSRGGRDAAVEVGGVEVALVIVAAAVRVLAPRPAPAVPPTPLPPPNSHRNRSRQRGAGVGESLEMAGKPPRRRQRGAGEQRAAPAAASPRNARRLEKEIKAEEDAPRRACRRKSTRAAPKAAPAAAADKVAAPVAEKEEDMSLALVPACTDAATHGTDAVEQSGCEGLCERIVELVMWKNVAKSALWFGLGSMFFFSCSFSREITFSPMSALCHLGVMILGLAFFKDSVPQRWGGG